MAVAEVDEWRIGVLVILSFVFYSYWNLPFVSLLALSITVNWLAVRGYLATKHAGFIAGSIVANRVILGFFKYADFVSEIWPTCSSGRSGISTSRCLSAWTITVERLLRWVELFFAYPPNAMGAQAVCTFLLVCVASR